jgi:hypothetical protein
MTPEWTELATNVIVILAALGGAYKFLDSRTRGYIASSEKLMKSLIKGLEIRRNEEIQEIKEKAEEAVHHGKEIEQNYNKKFQDTNTNITRTREEMITGFGKLEGLIIGVTTLIEMNKKIEKKES